MKGKDLGTYHVRVEFEDGRGFINTWRTGMRFTQGTDETSPLSAQTIAPTWKSEEHLIDTIRFMYTDGNYACDCNKSLFLARAQQLPDPDVACGDTLKIKRLTVIKPDGSEQELDID